MSSCYSRDEKINCINNIRRASNSNYQSNKLVSDLKDSIVKWRNDSVLRYSGYNIEEDWHFDSMVLFTKDSNRAFSWIYILIKNKKSEYNDHIEMYVAEKSQRLWKYYLVGMPTIAFPIDMNNGKHWTVEQLQKEIDNNLTQHLDIKNCKFKEQDKIINDYFQGNWDLYEMEAKFWNEHYKEKENKR